MKLDQKTALALMDEKCANNFGCKIAEATKQQIYMTLCMVVRDLLAEKNMEFNKKTAEKEDKQKFAKQLAKLAK